MADPVKIFDSASGETGGDVNTSNPELNLNKDAYFQVQIATGDTVVIEGKLDSTLSYVIVETITENTLKEIKLPKIFRGRRTVDGAVGDSTVYIQKLDPSRGL